MLVDRLGAMPGLAVSLAGTDKGNKARTASASWGQALGGLSQFSALSSVLSRQPRPGWGHPGFGASPPGLFLNLASRQSCLEAARPNAQHVSFPRVGFLTVTFSPPTPAPPAETSLFTKLQHPLP